MKKCTKFITLIVVLSLSSPVIAVNETNYNCHDNKLCLSSNDIMKEVVKETINVVGKKLLDKYLKEDEQVKTQNNTVQQSGSDTSNHTNTSNNNNSDSSTVVQEQVTTTSSSYESSSSNNEDTIITLDDENSNSSVSNDSSGSGDLIILD